MKRTLRFSARFRTALTISLVVVTTLPLLVVFSLGARHVTITAGAAGGRHIGPTQWLLSCTMYLYSTPFTPAWGNDTELDYIRVRKINQCSSWIAKRHAEMAIKDTRRKIRNAAFNNWVLGYEPYTQLTKSILAGLVQNGTTHYAPSDDPRWTTEAVMGFVEYKLRRTCRIDVLEQIRDKFGTYQESVTPTYYGNFTGQALFSGGAYLPPEYRWSTVDKGLADLFSIERVPQKKCS